MCACACMCVCMYVVGGGEGGVWARKREGRGDKKGINEVIDSASFQCGRATLIVVSFPDLLLWPGNEPHSWQPTWPCKLLFNWSDMVPEKRL